MEDDGHHDKQPEDEELQEQTTENHVLAQLHLARIMARHDASTATLDEEGEYVARDETLRQPRHADEREGFSVRGADESAERHVD